MLHNNDLALALLILFFFGSFANTTRSEEMIDLGTLGGDSATAEGINTKGQVVGASETPSGKTHAFLWNDGKMTDLGVLPGGDRSSAHGINSKGQVVGCSDISTEKSNNKQDGHAFFYSDGKMLDLGVLPGGTWCNASAINDSGQVVGAGDTANHETHAFLYEYGKMKDLGTFKGGRYSCAFAINAKGEIVGVADGPGKGGAFLYKDGKMIDLGTLGGYHFQSRATGINDAGQITGVSEMFYEIHGFFYANDKMIDLGVGVPCGIDAKGQVVGEWPSRPGHPRSVIWYNGQRRILNVFSQKTRNCPNAVNDKGEVVGVYFKASDPPADRSVNEVNHAFLFRPNAEVRGHHT